MIKIITGYSERGGSTVAFINLTNELNKRGYDCILYGPHHWHLDKCKSDLIKNLKFDITDRVISHVLKLDNRPNVKKIVLSSHENWWFEVANIKQYWDQKRLWRIGIKLNQNLFITPHSHIELFNSFFLF